jgi:hypothetical protein
MKQDGFHCMKLLFNPFNKYLRLFWMVREHNIFFEKARKQMQKWLFFSSEHNKQKIKSRIKDYLKFGKGSTIFWTQEYKISTFYDIWNSPFAFSYMRMWHRLVESCYHLHMSGRILCILWIKWSKYKTFFPLEVIFKSFILYYPLT